MNFVRNNSMSIVAKDVLKLLEAAPKLRPLVMRWARLAARGERLPATFSVADLGYDDQQSLERLPGAASRFQVRRFRSTHPRARLLVRARGVSALKITSTLTERKWL